MSSRSLKEQTGLAIVEFTIIAPILIILLIAISELGRAYYTYTQIEKISRDSSRYLSNRIIVGDSGSYDLTDQLVSSAKNLSLYGSAVDSSSTVINNLKEDHITIELNNNYITTQIIYPFEPVFAQWPAFFSDEPSSLVFDIVASYSMRVL